MLKDSGYIFRRAESEDIGGIYAVEILSFDKPWTIGMFTEDIIGNDKARYYVVEYNSEIVGYAGYWHIGDEAHITNIAVAPAHRRKGVASYMLRALEERFAAEGINRATLEAGAKNEAALKLYGKASYRKEGLRKNYYGGTEDAVIMWKETGGNDKDQG